jgi:hypothetical protein
MTGKEDAAEEMQYWAPHHLRAAVTATGVVLLDLKQNRYRGIGLGNASELASLAANWSHISTQSAALTPCPRETVKARAAAFIEAGLLSRERPDEAFQTIEVDLRTQLSSVGRQAEGAMRLRPHHVLNFVRACLWAKRSLRSRTLYSIACEISAEKKRAAAALDMQGIIDLVCLFRRLRPYAFEAQDRCLFHALALHNFLSRYDAHPTWVIGVTARPWAAHSWLQIDRWVLDGSPEDVCSFTPILAI